MKTRLIRLIIGIFIIAIIIASGGLKDLFRPSTVRAFGELTVDFNSVLPGQALFNVDNMAPGDPAETRNVDVHNGGSAARMVSVKGVRTDGIGDDPKIETVLEIVINDGSADVYGGSLGTKTVADFFQDSQDDNGVLLNIIPSGGDKTYNFKVSFPASAGDDFQGKSVKFDLTFGVVTGNNLVINEVYYQVDDKHGVDSLKDRGILANDGKNVTVIQNNGANSKNTIKLKISDYCKLVQKNDTTIVNNVSANASSGNNSANGNSGSASIITGSANVIIKILNIGSTNVSTGSCGCECKLGQNDEWVEIYNPTDHDISLKNWTLTDNSGKPTKINANKKVLAGGFALLSKSASTWKYWDEDPAARKIELGSQIGDGLDNTGDHLYLRNPAGGDVDFVAWGDDTEDWDPAVPGVSMGKSIERLVPGFDTDMVSDWHDQNPPTPGNKRSI